MRFVRQGPSAFSSSADVDRQARADSFRLLPGETVAGVLADHAAVAARTDEAVRTADLDRASPLPEAPWFARDGRASAVTSTTSRASAEVTWAAS